MSDTSSHPLHLFRINAGSCNGCDVELTVTEAVERFDVATLGCHYADTPEQAQIFLITGPLTTRLRQEVLALYAAAPAPKVTVAVGACGASCGVFRDSYAVSGPLEKEITVDLNIPGCPPRPQALLDGIAAAVRLYRQRRGETLPPLASASDVAVPERLRGAPRFAAAACVGCRVCAHVCAGGAIRFDDKEEGVALTLWENSCTFCGLCAHYCPSGALTLSNDWRRTHPQSQSYQQTVHGEVPQSPCSDCDASFTAAPPELLRRALGGTAAPIEPLRQLCPDCRRRHNLTFATRGVKR